MQCKKCGKSHNLPHKNNRPAYGTKCKKCGKLNHWQSVCRLVKPRPRSKSPRRRSRKQINNIEANNVGHLSEDIMTIGTIEIYSVENHDNDTREEIFTNLRVNCKNNRDINLKCKVDTDAQNNVLQIRLFRILYLELINAEEIPKNRAMKSNEMVLIAYGGAQITQFGTRNILSQHKWRNFLCRFCVTDPSGPAIMGIKACRGLNLVLLHCVLEAKAVQVHRDINQGASKKEIIPNMKREVRVADQPEVENQTQGKTENYIKLSVPIASRPIIISNIMVLRLISD